MGMFDTIVNSYKPLGEEFLNVVLQTKSLDRTSDYYWISPNGELYRYDLSQTWDWDWPNMNTRMYVKKIKTDIHGKITPCYITKKVNIYGSPLITPDTASWKEAVLYFKLGQLQTYRFVNRMINYEKN